MEGITPPLRSSPASSCVSTAAVACSACTLPSPRSMRTGTAQRGARASDGASISIRSPGCSASSCGPMRSEEHTSELQSPCNLVCRLLLEKKKYNIITHDKRAAKPQLYVQQALINPHSKLALSRLDNIGCTPASLGLLDGGRPSSFCDYFV